VSVCQRCVMDSSDKKIVFSTTGCNHCDKAMIDFKKLESTSSEISFEMRHEMLRQQSLGNRFLMGLSGGVDSSYLLSRLVEWGLRPVIFHVDGGWNRPEAVKNVFNLGKEFDLEIRTRIIDWKSMSDLQVAFLKSGLINQDMPQDHAFFSLLYSEARRLKISNIISGWNFQTESILPIDWTDSPMDKKIIQKVSSRYGTMSTRKYPTTSYFQMYFLDPYVNKIKVWKPLSYLNFNRVEAIQNLEKIGWENYGNKHEESTFTQYFQGYYLPNRFGIDKRKAHLSSLIVSKQISREFALQTLDNPAIPDSNITFLRNYIALKLEIDIAELTYFENMPRITGENLATNQNLKNIGKFVLNKFQNFKENV
jgi:hypothetical protein